MAKVLLELISRPMYFLERQLFSYPHVNTRRDGEAGDLHASGIDIVTKSYTDIGVRLDIIKRELERRLFSSLLVVAVILSLAPICLAQAPPPPDAPDVVDYHKLLPLLPDAPAGWTAEEPEGSTSDVGGFTLTNVHRDYKKGDTPNAPIASISILDSAANPEYASATTAAWNLNSETLEGYSKSITVEGHPGFEAYETERKHGSLWVMVAKRYFVQVELMGQDPKELQQWVKRVDLKKLAEIK